MYLHINVNVCMRVYACIDVRVCMCICLCALIDYNFLIPGSSKRSMAIGISVSISFVIIIIIPLICILVKFSKRRGKHELQKSSSIIPASMNNPCRLIDAGAMRKFSTNINAGHYPVEHIENSSSISERSQVVSSRDINIESNSFHVPANIDSRDRYLNKFNSLTNFGYLSEGTSGYDSENSSARSSANYSSRQSKR